MDIPARLANADEQSRELAHTYTQMENRIISFTELQSALTDLHEQLAALRKEMIALQTELKHVQDTLPSVARTEELERVANKINAVPFESLATRKDL